MPVQSVSFLDVTYPVGNESLDAVMAGLDLRHDDSVLCVGGSGDVGFAALERALHVRMVDENRNQAAYVSWLRDLLAAGEYYHFLRAPEEASSASSMVNVFCKRRSDYFMPLGDMRRLQMIRLRLDSLVIELSDVFSVSESYSKVYLSNALGYRERSVTVEEDFRRIAGVVASGGLVYVSNSWVFDVDGIGLPFLRSGPLDSKVLSSVGFEIDSLLTNGAQSLEPYWRVAVLRKTGG